MTSVGCLRCLVQRGREVDGNGRAAQAALGAHDRERLARRGLLERPRHAADGGIDLRGGERLGSATR